ncbi:enoyl-CoA hydratase/isomerase [Streptomyces hyaluromycini]|uniref:enoyl-CoA hydratase/isomerase n=1 Tax=Streptomyces hyaluromycini TaxID=1377993 RepID=UPI000B5CB423|nr:enoyl-CoA hydratase/isomerase [Streptomyces hyaluromycini]
MNYETIQVTWRDTVCHLQLHRPMDRNTINDRLIAECTNVLTHCEEAASVVVVEGHPDYFCFGADFNDLNTRDIDETTAGQHPDSLYDLFLKLATGPYVSVAHVRGKANAGGVGLVAASDVVVADSDAHFSLSELLFGLYPACVLPFLIRRCGFQNAHYMTLITRPFTADEAVRLHLADVAGSDSQALLRKQLTRLKCLPKPGIARYKRYMNQLNESLTMAKPLAVAGNVEAFTDEGNLTRIRRYVEEGTLPWQQ